MYLQNRTQISESSSPIAFKFWNNIEFDYVVFLYNFHLDITPVKGENLLFVKTEV
jgi:hypothetical protein